MRFIDLHDNVNGAVVSFALDKIAVVTENTIPEYYKGANALVYCIGLPYPIGIAEKRLDAIRLLTEGVGQL